ncbi:Pentatricopeptide repeat-containing protein, chloroplastic [Glycine soja]|uniref:Pentatricopeptide repeat-containing protein, chloroplastic n=1 Tax=Glycine soja TaxID=3848 RepID=A0A445M2W8_GLYSO|nr:Pentatricopeptide repeat-containing protein, chloroplastic [Glycine soja]
MPVEPNDVIWKTLLSACQNYENLSIGEPVGQQLTQLYSCSPSSYVLLSNIYASLGMWDNVKRVRTEMKEKQLKKIPVIFQDQGLFGYGLCIRNSHGAFVLAKTDCRMESPDAYEAEALSWIKELNYQHVIIELDSKHMVDSVHSNNLNLSDCGVVLQNCRQILSQTLFELS